MKRLLWSFLIGTVSIAGCAGNETIIDHQIARLSAKKLNQEQIDKEALTEEERFTFFVEKLKHQAAGEGIQPEVIERAFANIVLIKRVINSDKNQLEKKITLDDYLKRVITVKKTQQAQQHYKIYQKQLNKASKRYGVPTNYIVALWAMESNFGRLQGKENVISAMSTLAFEGRRQEFFTQQVMAALKILQDKQVPQEKLKGSWAGAMGQCQFMPTSYLTYGADGDGDGQIDIWSNINDVFASTANYLATEGWNKQQGWGKEVTLPPQFDVALAGLEDDKAKSVAQWMKLGVKVTTKNQAERKQKAWIILPDDELGRAFIVYENFKTIMHWNRSYYFAISIGQLADKLVVTPKISKK